MTDVTLYGLPPTTNTRTAQMVLAAKGVPYRLEVPDTRGEAYTALHPFRKVPALRHGALSLFEALAIATYVDEAFDGPALRPEDPAARAVMMQWISATCDYVYDAAIKRCVIERIVKPAVGGTTDEAVIAAALPDVGHALDVIDRALEGRAYLAGDAVSLADFFLAPIHVYLAATPEGQGMLPVRGNLQRWAERMADTPDFAQINAMG
ncbi:glutathione S-transferase family protein [Marimonas sp. MJW-29]|uniref:glutathione transferase n=1 Tax=Sulfitobacter sediminis TaxID=3234186 RepID=A0ABV3RQJ6_9RHOB